MGRFDLTDKEWQRIEPLCPSGKGKKGHPIESRRFIDAVLYRLRVGFPWRDLPSRYGNWHTVYVRYMDWCRRGIWQRIFEVLAARPSLRSISLDSTFVRCHRAAHGAAKKNGPQSIGRSRGGPTTKVHAAVDRRGRPMRVRLTPGNEADVTQAGALLSGLWPKAVVADKAYDADELVFSIRRRKARAVIPPKSNRVRFRWYDKTLYRERNKVERFFNRLKDFRCCATRFDKLDVSFLGMIYLAAPSSGWARPFAEQTLENIQYIYC